MVVGLVLLDDCWMILSGDTTTGFVCLRILSHVLWLSIFWLCSLFLAFRGYIFSFEMNMPDDA